MFAEWVTHGAQIGVEICTAAFTVVLIVGAIVGILGMFAKIWQEDDDENSKKTRFKSH